eukprot:TRINITY_DN19261_c0_g1_i2.p1 TRINITY_DN19261_c0_g1~~TRINITY_DN19261_c0_g1_i2.p1  ORF type:complete len:433 (-),score=97.41 TRINITY_DN19261_c0_g1_i2:13-1311(-)
MTVSQAVGRLQASPNTGTHRSSLSSPVSGAQVTSALVQSEQARRKRAMTRLQFPEGRGSWAETLRGSWGGSSSSLARPRSPRSPSPSTSAARAGSSAKPPATLRGRGAAVRAGSQPQGHDAQKAKGGSRSPDRRQRSPAPQLSVEAREWLEENGDRLASQTKKCLMVHCQLQELLSQQGLSGAVVTTPRAAALEAAAVEKPPSLRALEGAPPELLSRAQAVASLKPGSFERRDELRSELSASQQQVEDLKQELRHLQESSQNFEKAVEAGSQIELQRHMQEALVLEARLRDRLDAVKQLAAAKASPNPCSPRSPWSSPSPVARRPHSPSADGRAGAWPVQGPSMGRQLPITGTVVQPVFQPAFPAVQPLRTVSAPMTTAMPPTLIRVAAAAAAGAAIAPGPQAGEAVAAAHSLQRLDDARQRAQVEFWSGSL